MLNALFGVAYGLETPFFPQLVAPNLAPKTDPYRTWPDLPMLFILTALLILARHSRLGLCIAPYEFFYSVTATSTRIVPPVTIWPVIRRDGSTRQDTLLRQTFKVSARFAQPRSAQPNCSELELPTHQMI